MQILLKKNYFQFMNEFDEYFYYDKINLFNKRIHLHDMNGFNCQEIYFNSNEYINYLIEPLNMLCKLKINFIKYFNIILF